jgi:hypothetical protein
MTSWLPHGYSDYADHRGWNDNLYQEERMAIKRSMLYTATV